MTDLAILPLHDVTRWKQWPILELVPQAFGSRHHAMNVFKVELCQKYHSPAWINNVRF